MLKILFFLGKLLIGGGGAAAGGGGQIVGFIMIVWAIADIIQFLGTLQ